MHADFGGSKCSVWVCLYRCVGVCMFGVCVCVCAVLVDVHADIDGGKCIIHFGVLQYGLVCVLLSMVATTVFLHTSSMTKTLLLLSITFVFVVLTQLTYLPLLSNRDLLLLADNG